jgi:hypothetical protein
LLQGTQHLFQTATHLAALGGGARCAYVSDTSSNYISMVRVAFDGELDLLACFAAVRAVGTTPSDVANSRDGLNYCVLNVGSGSISAFTILPNGHLERLGHARALPDSAKRLAFSLSGRVTSTARD